MEKVQPLRSRKQKHKVNRTESCFLGENHRPSISLGMHAPNGEIVFSNQVNKRNNKLQE